MTSMHFSRDLPDMVPMDSSVKMPGTFRCRFAVAGGVLLIVEADGSCGHTFCIRKSRAPAAGIIRR